VEFFDKNLKAVVDRESNVIEVLFKNENPAVAAQAINTLIEFFKDKHVEVYSDPKSSFLEEQTREYREKLRETETTLQTFKQKHQVFSLDEQRTALLKQRSELDIALKSTETQIRELQERIAFVKSPRWNIDIGADGKNQLAILEQKEQAILDKYTENSRAVQSIRTEIQARRDSIQRGLEDSRRIELSRLQGEVGALQAKADGIRRQLGQVVGEVQALDGREKDFSSLKRELGTHEANYKAYLGKSEEARISEDLDKRKMSNVSVLQAATVPVEPAKNDRLKYFFLTLIIGLGGGIGLAFVRERVPQRCTTALSAEKHLGLPVIVAITLRQ
jgi:polysaccharide biosynthesis protein PslE